MGQAELVQVLALGRGIEPNGNITDGTRQRALATSQFVKANLDGIVSVDFSGSHSCYQEPPMRGSEASGMALTAAIDQMPTTGFEVFLDEEADDTVGNFLCGLNKGYLQPDLDTCIATHGDHWPRAHFLGSLAMPRATLSPIMVRGGYSKASLAKERVLLQGYRHVMRNVQPGDLPAIEAANTVIKRAAMSVLYPAGLGHEVSMRQKVGYMWDVLRGEG